MNDDSLRGEIAELKSEVLEDKARLREDLERERRLERELAERHKTFIEIVVNGRPKRVESREISFEEVTALAFGSPPPGVVVGYSVTYWHPGGTDGSLTAGEVVKIRNGMVFSVTETSRS